MHSRLNEPPKAIAVKTAILLNYSLYTFAHSAKPLLLSDVTQTHALSKYVAWGIFELKSGLFLLCDSTKKCFSGIDASQGEHWLMLKRTNSSLVYELICFAGKCIGKIEKIHNYSSKRKRDSRWEAENCFRFWASTACDFASYHRL
jgi:hypothetical protein